MSVYFCVCTHLTFTVITLVYCSHSVTIQWVQCVEWNCCRLKMKERYWYSLIWCLFREGNATEEFTVSWYLTTDSNFNKLADSDQLSWTWEVTSVLFSSLIHPRKWKSVFVEMSCTRLHVSYLNALIRQVIKFKFHLVFCLNKHKINIQYIIIYEFI